MSPAPAPPGNAPSPPPARGLRRPGVAVVGALLLGLSAWCAALAFRTSRLKAEAEEGVTWLRKSEAIRTAAAAAGVELAAGRATLAAQAARDAADPAFLAAAPAEADDGPALRAAWTRATETYARAVSRFAAAPTRDDGSAAARDYVAAHHAFDVAIGDLRASVSRRLRAVNVDLVRGWNSLWLLAAVAFVALGVVVVLLFQGAVRNDELRRSRAALEASERRFRAMADDAPVVMWLEDAGGRNTFVNRRWFEITGRPWTDSFEFYDVVHPEDVERVRAAYAAGRAARAGVDVEYRLRSAAGPWRWFYDRAVPRFGAGGEFFGFHGVAVDVTERREFERRAAEALRLEAVGRLAGGVAHDFNNFLTVVLGCAEDIDRVDADEAGRARAADDLRRAAALAASLTGRLLAFTRQDVAGPGARVDLYQALTEFEPLLRRMIGEDVRLELRCAPGVGFVAVDPGRLTQLVVNLAANARQAMPEGGLLRIEARPLPEDEAHVLLAFEDDGVGMTEDVRARLFEPFFTTKSSPGNVGLGLATVDAVLKQIGGTVTVRSAEGRGSRFEILLPRASAGRLSDPPPAAPAPPAVAADRPRPLVLLAEDDDAIRGLARRYLTDAGYDVVDAADGEAALAASETLPRPPDALFTDVIMPGLSGGRLAERLRERFPGLKVLFLSGYTDDHVVRHGVSKAESEFLPKPFARAQLVRKAREVLGGRAPGGGDGAAR